MQEKYFFLFWLLAFARKIMALLDSGVCTPSPLVRTPMEKFLAGPYASAFRIRHHS